MKYTLLFTISLLFSLATQAQEYCEYNTQKGYNFGDDYNDEAYSILQQSNGRFVIIGTTYTIATNSFHIVGIRVYPNGNLDPTFGDLGKIDVTFDQRNTAVCAVLQDDDKILVGGYQASSNGVSTFRPYVARFNADGSIDTDFGDSGSALVPFADTYSGEVAAIEVLDDGSIQVVSNHINVGFSASRLLPNGDPDNSYGLTGYVTGNVANTGLVFQSPSSLILEDGTSYWVGHVYDSETVSYYMSIGKVDPDGALDTDFGQGGIQIFEDVPSSFNVPIRSELALDDNILVSSVSPDNIPFIMKVDSNTGELVTEFGVDGIALAPVEAVNKQNFDFVLDEVNQEWVLLFGDSSPDVATMRIDDNGNILLNCNSFFHIPDIQSAGSQSYTSGLFDQDGVLRISGTTAVEDENSEFTQQNRNFMWPKYEPPYPDPIILSVSPEEILSDEPVQLTISGFGFAETESIKLASLTDTLTQFSFEVISNEELHAIFNPESAPEGIRDLMVILPTDTLYLLQSVSIINGDIIDGDVNLYSRTRILVGAQNVFSASYANTGNKSMLAAPFIVINETLYSLDFTTQPMYDLEEDEMMDSFILYLQDQDIDPGMINETQFQSDEGQSHAMLTTHLAPQHTKNLGGLSTIPSSVSVQQHMYLHPNPLVESSGLIEPYEPTPGACQSELVKSALLTAIPGVDLGSYDACFELAFTQLQLDLAAIARGIDDQRMIPMKGAMMKLLFDLMLCIDEDYLLSETEFETFNAEMAVLYATDVILNDGFPCDAYLEASTNYHGFAPIPEQVIASENSDRSDPWGIGINFNFCYGCKTMNDIEGVSSLDPNEKIGPSQEYGGTHINDPHLQYAIHFENVDTADVAAKTVLIVDTLDLDVIDINTFKFTNVSWADTVITLNEEAGETEIDLRPEFPNILKITSSLDELTGTASWLFQTLDTLSMMPTEDVDQGFLPPNVNAPEGMGFVGFEVDLLENVPSGSLIENTADIYFDFNDPITTNTWTNLFDSEAPESEVLEVTEYTLGENVATIEWETADNDPYILHYNIYYNTDGSSEWIPWQIQTTENSAVFEGELDMTYYFISVAVDSAFNVEPFPDDFDAFIHMQPVSVEEQADLLEFHLYPNPANEEVMINLELPIAHTAVITDMMGRIVFTQQLDPNRKHHKLKINSLSKGFYNVAVLDAVGFPLGIEKLVKN